MKTDWNKIIQPIVEKRKNPLLLLNLEEVSKSCVLRLADVLKGKTFEELDVVLQTGGGDIDSAYQIVKLIRRRSEKVNMIVPFYAKSAGTLICLGADEILLTELTELGPLDAQVREVQDGDSPDYRSALNGFKALEQIQQHALATLDTTAYLIIARSGGMKLAEAISLANGFIGQTSGKLYEKLDPKQIGSYARALEIGERYGISILHNLMGWTERKAKETVKKLVWDYPSHGFIIDKEELNSLGLTTKEIVVEVEIEGGKKVDAIDKLRHALLGTSETVIDLHEPIKSAPETKGVQGERAGIKMSKPVVKATKQKANTK